MNALERSQIVAEFLKARWRADALHGAALRRYQDQHALRVITFTNKHSPFYCRHWAGHDREHWRTLPTVEKQTMMANFHDFNTRGVTREAALDVAMRAERSREFGRTLHGLTVGLSSGTSGHRGLFLVSPSEQRTWAGTILARTLPRLKRGGYRVAFFLRSDSKLYQQADDTFIQLRYFDLMLPIPTAVDALNRLEPDIIVAPPSLLGLLSEQRRQGKLCVHPLRLYSVAEVLEPQDQRAVESAFEAPVLQIYQCTEGLLGISCERGSLHIQEDLVALQFEPLDGGGERVTPVITDLHRLTQPIIRYRLNDVLQLAPRACACGCEFRVIRAVDGRSDDACYFESTDGGLVLFFPDTIRRMVLLASDDIQDYQVFQDQCGALRIHVEPSAGADFDRIVGCVRESVIQVALLYGCRLSRLTVEPGLVNMPPGAKRRRVQRLG